MRHGKKGRKLASGASHRRAVLRNLARELITYERIRTTEAKAKELKPYVDNLITLAKKGDLAARRRAISALGNGDVVHKLFTEVAERFKEREGGYTRLLKLGPRQGDAAFMVLIELV